MKRHDYALIGLALVAGCIHPHVALERPRATPEARVRAYERARPIAVVEERMSGAIVSSGFYDLEIETSLELADGRVVYHAEDLLPLVRPDSPTARNTRAADSASFWGWTALAIAGATGVTFVSLALGVPKVDLGRAGQSVGITLALAPLAFGILSAYLFHRESVYEAAAFRTYGTDLRGALGICGREPDFEACGPSIAP